MVELTTTEMKLIYKALVTETDEDGRVIADLFMTLPDQSVSIPTSVSFKHVDDLNWRLGTGFLDFLGPLAKLGPSDSRNLNSNGFFLFRSLVIMISLEIQSIST